MLFRYRRAKKIARAWVSDNGHGVVLDIAPVPDWVNGKRLRVDTAGGVQLLFYFTHEDGLCSVVRAKPDRKRLYDSDEPECRGPAAS